MSRSAPILLLALATTALADGPVVRKVDPPSWWAGHSIESVRLLVRGEGLRGARVESARPEVRPSDVRVNDRGTSLFVTVGIDPAAPGGDYPLTVRTDDGEASVPFRLDAMPDPGPHFLGIGPDDVIYLIMPDRFADGDPSNNAPAGSPPGANDRRNPRAFHGGDFRGIIDHLPYLKDLGVTALWLNPWYDNSNALTECDHPWCPYTAYHGYHPIDHYAVEDHFGDLASLRELVEAVHALGLKVIQDQVMNHVGLSHPWVDDPPTPTWFHGSKASHLRNPFRLDLLVSPHASPAARRPVLDGWFADDLPDLNQDDPEVARYLIQNALWWIGVAGLDGVRFDTAPFVPRAFLRDLNAAIHRQHPRVWTVGEILDYDAVNTGFYLGGRPGWDGIDTGLDSVFDFALLGTSTGVFLGKTPASALPSQLRTDRLFPDPSRLATLTGNHDLRRFPSLDGATPEGNRLHLAFILATRGIPQLLYGDEIGLPGGEDPDNRRDFPGGFPGDPRNAFEDRGRDDEQRRTFDWVRAWLTLRREHPSMRRGALIDLAADADTYAFARRDDRETVVIALNRAGEAKDLAVPAEALDAPAGSRFVPLLGGAGPIAAGEDGFRLIIPPRGAVALEVRAE